MCESSQLMFYSHACEATLAAFFFNAQTVRTVFHVVLFLHPDKYIRILF